MASYDRRVDIRRCNLLFATLIVPPILNVLITSAGRCLTGDRHPTCVDLTIEPVES
jgi:hypothetical protein